MAKSEEEVRKEFAEKTAVEHRKKEQARRDAVKKAQVDAEKRNQAGVWSA